MIPNFELGPLPRIVFGAGTRKRLPELAARHGRRVLLVTGVRSLRASAEGRALVDSFGAAALEVHELAVAGEPSPAAVDEAVARYGSLDIDVVVGIGGGSTLDLAKAVAGLLPSGRPIMDHLEEVGRGMPYTGPATPLIAVPTTAGTGSEATRNAVVSEHGQNGFKRSFRSEELVPRWAVVDPDLLATCPRDLIAADGFDALTQLLESYVSRRSGGVTDALAEHGLRAARDGLLPWYEGTGDPGHARSAMAYAAMLSGVTLAHAGLGVVHGLSAPLGAFFAIPHGVACGTLVAAATAVNIRALRSRDADPAVLEKYGRAWTLLAGAEIHSTPPNDAPERLVALLEEWTGRLDQPRLGAYGVRESEVARIVAAGRGGSTKTNPVFLTDEEMAEIVHARQ